MPFTTTGSVVLERSHVTSAQVSPGLVTNDVESPISDTPGGRES
jgi:hypothetical protein